MANVADTHYVIGSAVGPAPFPAMVRDLQRVIGDEAPRPDAGRAGPVAGPGDRLRRRWRQLDRHVRRRSSTTRLSQAEQRPDLLAAAANGTHAHSLRSIDAVSISAAYGITNDFTVAVRAGGVRRSGISEPADDMLSGGHMGMMNAGDMSSLMSPDGINRRGNSAGFGDVTMLGQYRFHNNAQTGTSAAVLFGFKAPTGSTNQRDAAGQLFQAEFQPGSGSWDGLFGAAFTKRAGRWSFDVERPLLSDHQGHAEHQSRRPLPVRHRGVISPGRRHRLGERGGAARILHAATQPDCRSIVSITPITTTAT